MLRIQNSYVPFERNRGICVADLIIPARGLSLLTGPNGSGKSSLLRCIAGLKAFKGGAFYLDDTEVTRGVLRQNTTYLSQRPYLFDTTILGNLRFPIRHLDRQSQYRAIDEVGKRFSIDGILQQKARALSGGQKQRVAIARAYLTQNPIMLFDEPYSGLDNYARSQLTELLQLIGTEKSLVLTSHESLSDRIIPVQHLHIHQGHVVKYD